MFSFNLLVKAAASVNLISADFQDTSIGKVPPHVLAVKSKDSYWP